MGARKITSRIPIRAIALEVRNMKIHEYATAWMVIPTSKRNIPSRPREGNHLKVNFKNVEYDLPQLPEEKVSAKEAVQLLARDLIRAIQVGRDISQGSITRWHAYISQQLDSVMQPHTNIAERAKFIDARAMSLRSCHTLAEWLKIYGLARQNLLRIL